MKSIFSLTASDTRVGGNRLERNTGQTKKSAEEFLRRLGYKKLFDIFLTKYSTIRHFYAGGFVNLKHTFEHLRL